MPAPTLTFLQNFYTDVTLYVPPEAAVTEEVPVPGAAAVADAPPVAPLTVAAPLPAAAAAVAAAVPVTTAPPAPAPLVAAPAVVLVTAAQPPTAPAPAVEAPVPAALHTTFSTQGSNAQGVVLLVRLPHEQFLKLPRNVFLNKLLQAIGLVMADVVLVNVEHEKLPVALANLRRELAATRILAFGRYLLDVTVRNTQIYEPVQFPAQDLGYLASAEVEMVEYDVSLKKRLWGGLQRMFL